jgi:hypothetical protein
MYRLNGLNELINSLKGRDNLSDFLGANLVSRRETAKTEVEATLEIPENGDPALVRLKGRRMETRPLSMLTCESASLLQSFILLNESIISLRNEVGERKEARKRYVCESVQEREIISYQLAQKYPEQAIKGELFLQQAKECASAMRLTVGGLPVEGVEVKPEFGSAIMSRIVMLREAERRVEQAEKEIEDITQRIKLAEESMVSLMIKLSRSLTKNHAEIFSRLYSVDFQNKDRELLLIDEVDEILSEMPKALQRRVILEHLAGQAVLPLRVIEQFDLAATIEAVDHLLPARG